eukprot:COSAG01_NODE_1691_length_9480_cov_5.430231_9_plen_443_part_00
MGDVPDLGSIPLMLTSNSILASNPYRWLRERHQEREPQPEQLLQPKQQTRQPDSQAPVEPGMRRGDEDDLEPEPEVESAAPIVVVADSEQKTTKRSRFVLLEAASADRSALVLAHQRLAWATSLLPDGCTAGTRVWLRWLPYPAMQQISEYQHSFILPSKLEALRSMLPRSMLTNGARCDARDRHGHWYPAYVADVTPTSGSASSVGREREAVLIHFVGLSERFREWFDLLEQEELAAGTSGGCRLAPLGFYTKRKARNWWLARDRWVAPAAAAAAMAQAGGAEAVASRHLGGPTAGAHAALRLLPACIVCNQADDREQTVLCEGCEHTILHTCCASPPMHRVPRGIWYCESCRARGGMAPTRESDTNVEPNVSPATIPAEAVPNQTHCGLVWLQNIRATMGPVHNSIFESRNFGWVRTEDVRLARQQSRQSATDGIGSRSG